MTTGCKLFKEDAMPQINQSEYRSMIGSLLYLTASTLDIMQAVRIMARFQAFPCEIHVVFIKMVLKYLQDTTKYGM